MIVKLVDINTRMVIAWKNEFSNYANLEIHEGSIFEQNAQAIVSPANSFGIMDGGLDGKLRDFFGKEIENLVRDKIEKEYFGELPVGCAVTVKTGNKNFPILISAPTMRVPENIATTQNVYLSMRAILLQCLINNIESVLIPGLGALSGQMPFEIVARQMRVAYDKIIRKSVRYAHWREEKELQRYMQCELDQLPFDYEQKW